MRGDRARRLKPRLEIADAAEILDAVERHRPRRQAQLGKDRGGELPLEGVEAFITDHQITFPTLMDTAGKVYEEYKITGMPTTFIIDHEGYFIGYVQGALSRELMDYYVDQAIEEMAE